MTSSYDVINCVASPSTRAALLTLVFLPTLYELIEAWVLRRREED
jgi:hypothetical protein